MKDKTQKISTELHAALRLYAAKSGRTLQSVTDEVIRDGLQARGIDFDETFRARGRDTTNDKDTENDERGQPFG